MPKSSRLYIKVKNHIFGPFIHFCFWIRYTQLDGYHYTTIALTVQQLCIIAAFNFHFYRMLFACSVLLLFFCSSLRTENIIKLTKFLSPHVAVRVTRAQARVLRHPASGWLLFAVVRSRHLDPAFA